MIVEVAETQEEEVGDGTTTAAVLTGELLAQAEDLLDDDLHPTVIVEGYHEAARLAQEAIDAQVLDVELDDDLLEQVAESSMTGKGTGDVTADVLAKHVVKAVRQVADEDGDVDRDDIHIQTKTGSSSSATELVEGVIIDKEPANDNMPRKVEDATVAVLDMKLEIRKGEVDTEYNITTVEQLTAAIEAEDNELRGYAKTLKDAGVDVVFCTKKIEDRVAGYLADAGILAFKNVKSKDAKALARATGAKRLGSLSDLDESDFGHADSVRVKKYGDDDDLTFVEGGAASKSVTLFLRGGTEHVVDELERAMNDAVDVVIAALEAGGVVPGAGATEIAIADHIRSESAGIEGRKQLAVLAFADAVDSLPRTLAENTGMDPIDALVDLRARFEAEGRAGLISAGRAGEIGDPVEHGIIDPAAVKREAVESATEAATMIIRIDDVIAAE
jgi:thermosome